MNNKINELVLRLKARKEQAVVVGGCNMVPVPMFLFVEAIELRRLHSACLV